jgi:hypothetical protein
MYLEKNTGKVVLYKSINIKIMAVKNCMVYIKTRLQFASKQPSLHKYIEKNTMAFLR